MRREDLITDEYLHLNQKLHREKDVFGCSGWHWANAIADLIQKNKIKSWLDYGCGMSSLVEAIKERCPSLKYEYTEYDPCMVGKDDMPEPAELVTCTDVLEHVEKSKINNVLSHITELTQRISFFVIATKLANRKLSNGKNTHSIVKGSVFWEKKLKSLSGWRKMKKIKTKKDYKSIMMIGVK